MYASALKSLNMYLFLSLLYEVQRFQGVADDQKKFWDLR